MNDITLENSLNSDISNTSSEFIPTQDMLNYSFSKSFNYDNSTNNYRKNQSNLNSLSKILRDFIPWINDENDDDLPPAEAAAILLTFAKDGTIYKSLTVILIFLIINIKPSIGQDTDGYKLSPNARLCYRRRHKYNIIFRISAWSLCILEIFRRPVWTYNHPNDWNNQLIFPSSGIVYAPPICCEILMTIAMFIILYAIILELGYEKQRNRMILLKFLLFILLLIFIDMIVAITTYSLYQRIYFSTTPIEALTIVFVERKFSSKVRYFVRTLPNFLMIITLLAGLICTYTAIGFLIFDPNSLEGKQYFPSYGVALWNMLMVLNGSNWPTPMMPAYNLNRGYFIYFFIYLVVFNWGLLNVILGFIYMFFKTEKEFSSSNIETIQNTNICRAFHILDKEGKGFLTYIQVMSTIDVIFKQFEWRDNEPNDIEKFELVRNLDKQQNGIITLNEFLHILDKCDGHNLRLLRSKTHFQRLMSQTTNNIDVYNSDFDIYNKNSSFRFHSNHQTDSRTEVTLTNDSNNNNSNNVNNSLQRYLQLISSSTTLSQLLLNFSILCDSIYFDFIIDTILFIIGLIYVINIFNVIIQDVLIIIILTINLFELIIKIVIKGFFRYRKSYRSSFDGLFTIILLIVFICNCINDNFIYNTHQYGLRVLVLIRVIIYPRNLLQTERFTMYRRRYKHAFEHAFNGAGHFIFLIIFLLVSMYIFSSLGVQLFGGTINYNNINIITSLYGANGYWPLNFNDLCSGFVTIFVLLHVNNMHVTTSGFVAGSNTLWAELFFAVWYIVGVLFLLNIIIVFFLSEFINYLQSSMSHHNMSKHGIINTMHDNIPNNTINELNNDDLDSNPTVQIYHNSSISPTDNNITNSAVKISHYQHSTNNDINVQSAKFSVSVFADYTNRETLKGQLETAFRASKYGKKVNRFSQVGGLTASILQEDVSDRHDDDSINSSTINNNENIYHSTLNTTDVVNDRISYSTDWLYGNLTIHPYEKAAVLVQLARYGIDHQVQFLSKRRSLDCYRLCNKYSSIFRLSSWLLTVLRIFERPLWTYSQENDWKDTSIYPMSGIPFLPFNIVVSFKLILVVVLLLGLLLELGYEENSYEFLKMKSLRTICRYILIIYAFIQIIVTFVALTMNNPPIILISSFIVEIYIFWFNRKSIQKLFAILSILPQMMIIIGFLAILILFFAIFGPYIYDVQNAKGLDDDYDFAYFGSYGSSVWSIFVAITSSSYPNQIMPAYRINRTIFFYFFIFITIGAFGILNFILVYVLYKYQKAIQQISDSRKILQNLYLLKAFEVLDINHSGYINKTVVKALLDELYYYYYDFRKFGIPSDEKRWLMVSILDVDNDNKISLKDFFFILDITRLSLKDKEYAVTSQSTNAIANCFKNSLLYKLTLQISNNKYTELLIELFIVILIITSLSITTNIFAQSVISTAFAIIIYIFIILETLIKLFHYGIRRFYKRIKNLLNLLICTLLSVLFIVLIVLSYNSSSKYYSNIIIAIRVTETIRIILFPFNVRYILRKSLLIRFSRIMTRIFRSLASLTIAFYIIAYIYISIGVLCYGGKITTSNGNGNPYYDQLVTSNYGLNGFYTLNFNDFPSGFVTLFSCLHVSDFDVIASGFVAVTSTYSRIYFTIWYVVGVLLLLNIIKSFFLAGFLQGVVTTYKRKVNRYVPFNSNSNSIKSNILDGDLSIKLNEINEFDKSLSKSSTIELAQSPNRSNEMKIENNELVDSLYRETFAIDPSSIIDHSQTTTKKAISIDSHVSTESNSNNNSSNYIVSMENVKDLNGSDREKLRLRLQNLSLPITPLGPLRGFSDLWNTSKDAPHSNTDKII